MPRLPRAETAPGIHHVYARGNRKQPIFADDRDRRRYLALLEDVVRRTGWRILSYCLMGNHMHLLIETQEPNLGIGMHRLHGSYAQYFNRRHGFSGHLFQDRYDSVTIENDAQLWTAAAYIARNPVTAGLCQTATEYLWSSHADVVNGWCAPDWLDTSRLLSYFSQDGGDGLERYKAMVALPPSPRKRKNLKRDSPSLRTLIPKGAEEGADEPQTQQKQRDDRRPPDHDPGVVEEIRDHDQRQNERDGEAPQARNQVLVGRFDDEGAIALVESQAVRGRRRDEKDDRRRGEQQGGVEDAPLKRRDALETLGERHGEQEGEKELHAR